MADTSTAAAAIDEKRRVNFPPDPNPRTLRFAPPPGTCDTHFHVFGPPHVFPYAETRLYTPPAAPIEHYFSMAKRIGVERAVLVVPTVHGADNTVMHDAIAKGEGRLRGMIKSNPALTEADNRELHARGVRGVRFNWVGRLRGESGAFDVDRFLRVVGHMEPFGWPVDLHLDPHHLDERGEVIRRIPVPVIIDHFGQIDSKAGVDQPLVRVLCDLLSLGHVYVKVSCADRQIARGARYEDVVALARVLIEHAPDRIIWGTDWPHSFVWEAGKMANDGDLMNMLPDFAPDEAVRRKVLVDNPARLFEF